MARSEGGERQQDQPLATKCTVPEINPGFAILEIDQQKSMAT
jgi:hypothetical protein